MKYLGQARPRVLAHRGYSRLFTENTLPAFKAALASTPYIEMDVWLSSDGKPVVHHDERLDRVFGMDQAVWAMTSAQLRDLFPKSAGARTPTQRRRGAVSLSLREIDHAALHWGVPQFEECLTLFPNACINVELKQESPELIVAMIQLLDRYNAWDRVLVTAENGAIMRQLRAKLPSHAVTGISLDEGIEFMKWVAGGAGGPYRAPGSALQVPLEFQGLRLDSAPIIQAAAQAGLEMHFWTINDVSEAQRLVDAGAQGIFTDDPEVMATLALPLEKSVFRD